MWLGFLHGPDKWLVIRFTVLSFAMCRTPIVKSLVHVSSPLLMVTLSFQHRVKERSGCFSLLLWLRFATSYGHIGT